MPRIKYIINLLYSYNVILKKRGKHGEADKKKVFLDEF